jgi:hypothetical protein
MTGVFLSNEMAGESPISIHPPPVAVLENQGLAEGNSIVLQRHREVPIRG